MIVRDRPTGLRLLFLWRGSVVQKIIPQLAVTVLLAVAVTIGSAAHPAHRIALTPIPFTLIGLALAIFLGFRNNASYERFTEGRRLWGELIIGCRSLARQWLTLLAARPVQPGRSAAPACAGTLRTLQVRLVYRLIAFAYALRNRLRELEPTAGLAPYLHAQELERARCAFNAPAALLLAMGEELRELLDRQLVGEYPAMRIDQGIDRLGTVLAGCERIKTTPIPFSYTVLLHRTVYMYCFLLPFGLIDVVGRMTPVVVGVVAYTFFALNAIGDEIEEPFGTMPNDLPLDALCRSIEIELRQCLGETALPEPLQPVDYNLA